MATSVWQFSVIERGVCPVLRVRFISIVVLIDFSAVDAVVPDRIQFAVFTGHSSLR